MRSIIALLFAFLAVGALAKSHQDSKLGNAFKMLAEIAQSDDSSDINEVLAVIQNVEGEIQSIINNIQAQYDSQEESAQSDFANYQANIDELSSQLDLVNQQIAADESEAAALQSQIDEELSTIQEASQALGDEQTRRANAHAAFTANYDAIQGAIDAGQEALNLLLVISQNDNTQTMIEITHKKLAKAFKHIHKTIETLSMKKTFSSMTSVLLEITQNGINQDAIGQINALINALIDTLNDELDVAVAAENSDIAYSAQTCDNLQSTIDAATQAANNNQEQLDAVNDDLDNLNAAAANLQSTLAAATSARDTLVANWVNTANSYEALLARLEGDLSALEDAETFLQ